MKKIKLYLYLFFLLGSFHSLSRPLELISDPIDDPESLPGSLSSLSYFPHDLPNQGKSNHKVWTGHWYPLSQNGTAKHLKKYDKVTNNQDLATQWEINYSKKYGNISWAGHCNGLAAAGTMTKEPKRGVHYKGVYFNVKNIKALLIETWQGGGYLVGRRCNNNYFTFDAYGRIEQKECRDSNAGSFHLIVTNFLGRFKKPIILDIDTGHAVWNYPVIEYNILEKVKITEKEASKLVGASGDFYPFNIESTQFMKISIKISLVHGKIEYYDYVLEGAHNGDIIGGEWIESSKKHHPDFIWRHTRPTPENPYIDIDIVKEIYEKSI